MPQYPYSPVNNNLGALATLTAASTGGNSVDQNNAQCRGVVVGVNITAITGTSPTLTVTIQGKDTASGEYYTLLASAALTAVGFTELMVYPGATVTANVAASSPLPQTWRVSYAVGGTTPAVTATVGACLLV